MISSFSLSTKNVPCHRILLVRVPQCEDHAAQVANGVQSGQKSGKQLTAKGKEMIATLLDRVDAFIRGPRFLGKAGEIEFEPTRFGGFLGDDRVKATHDYMATKYTAFQPQMYSSVLDAVAEPIGERIRPIVLFGSTAQITHARNTLIHTKTSTNFEDNVRFCPPLCSCDMIDYIVENGNTYKVVHTLMNTGLVPDVAAWWNNA